MILEALTAAAIGMRGYYPPVEFDHDFPGTVEVYFAPAPLVKDFCVIHGIACVISLRPGERCVILFNNDWAHELEAIMRHEIGHCNGWPQDHPGAR